MKPVAATLFAVAVSACAQSSAGPAPPKVRHVIGLDGVKGNATGSLTLRDKALHFEAGKARADVPVTSIDDVFIGTEVTQGGGKTGRLVKTAAIAAPFESGKALTILLRTKVDIMTVAFHDPDGAVHGAIFALPKGQAAPMRDQLVQAGAHASPEEKAASEGAKQ